jgi:hypothetical protein
MDTTGHAFEYNLTVHQLRPWPLNNSTTGGPQFLAIGWQRGKQTGAIDAVKAKVTAKGYGVYMFNEDLTISANLRKVRQHVLCMYGVEKQGPLHS